MVVERNKWDIVERCNFFDGRMPGILSGCGMGWGYGFPVVSLPLDHRLQAGTPSRGATLSAPRYREFCRGGSPAVETKDNFVAFSLAEQNPLASFKGDFLQR